MDDNILKLTDEDGRETEFELLDLIEYKGKQYVVLFPLEEGPEDEAVIMQVEDCGDEDMFFGVDSDKTLQAVFQLFQQRYNETTDKS